MSTARDDSPDDASHACSITVLQAKPGKRATKQHTWRADPKPGRWDTLPYAAGDRFLFEEHPVANIRDVGALIDRLRGDPNLMVVRGAISQAAREEIAQGRPWLVRKLSGPGVIGSLDDVPRYHLMVDIDNYSCALLDLIDDPEAVVRRAIAELLPAEFQDVTCFFQFSCSTGFKNGVIGIHLWCWLDRPLDSPTIKRWLKDKTVAINPRAKVKGACKVDCSILSGNIPHYIADPIVEGGHDPLPRRTGFIEGEADFVTLPEDLQTSPNHKPFNATWTGSAELKRQYDKLASALSYVPNDDVDREDWVRIGLAIKAHLGEHGRDLWLEWSKSSSKSGASGKTDTAEKAWDCFHPTSISGRTIFYLARKAGWEWDDNSVPADHGLPAFYPAPTEPRVAALLRQNDAIRAAIAAGALRGAVRAESRRQREEALGEVEDREALSRTDKARISRRARRAALAAFGLPKLPVATRTLVTGAQGTGKTTEVARALAEIRGSVAVRVLVPTEDKAAEFLADYQAAAGPDSLPAIHVRGRASSDGETFLCPRHKVVTKAINKGVNVRENICKTCQLRPIALVQLGCGYEQQYAAIAAMRDRGGVFIGSHQYLHVNMPGPQANIVIVDEAVPLIGADILEVSPSALFDPMPFPATSLSAATAANITSNATVRALQQDAPVAALAAADITPDRLKDAISALSAAQDDPGRDLSGDMEDVNLNAAIEAIPEDKAGKALIVLSAVLRELKTGRHSFAAVVFHPQREVTIDGKKERMPRLRVHRLKPVVGVTRQTTVLLLDGTGNLDLNEAQFGPLKHVHTPVERDAYVIGTTGKSYSRQSITGCDRNGEARSSKLQNEAARLRQDIATIAARQPGEVFVAASLKAAEVLAPEMPSNVTREWHKEMPPHFNALRGLNTWEDCATAVAVGRESISVEQLEDFARCFMADDPLPFVSHADVELPADWPWKKGWPFRATRGRRMRDGSVQPVEVEVHPDPRCQRILEQIREAEIVQSVDRVRPVFNRRRVVAMNSLVLDLTYDRVWSHADLAAGGPLLWRLFHAYGMLPLGKADLYEAYRTEFVSENATKWALQKAHGKGVGAQIISIYLEFHPLSIFRYRRSGQRGSDNQILVNLARHPDPRAAVEAVLGPLAVWELVEPQQAQPQAEPSPAEPDPAEEPPAPPQPPRRRNHRWPPRAPGRSRRRRRGALGGGLAEVVQLFDQARAAPTPAPPLPSREQIARLKDLSRRLAVARPPQRWGDEFDQFKEDFWRQRMAAARERWLTSVGLGPSNSALSQWGAVA
jgi:hypothetical protein